MESYENDLSRSKENQGTYILGWMTGNGTVNQTKETRKQKLNRTYKK